jgi:hypothetical protein
MDSTTTFTFAALAYAGAAIGVATGYWSKTQSTHPPLLPNHLVKRFKIMNLSGSASSNGWNLQIEKTDILRLIATSAGVLWPAYLLVCLFYQATRRIGA